MDVREKLVELVDKARRYAANKCHSFMSCAECDHYGEHDGNCRNTYIAESLIADGVIVHECARPLEEWGEDYGDVLWWKFPIEEPPYVGSPLDEKWPAYHTHWTPIVMPQPPKGE